MHFIRTHVDGDVYHYHADWQVGDSPNGWLRIHRVVRDRETERPAPTAGAIMLLHSAFSTFVTNFVPQLGKPASTAPSMAVFLANRGFDVWGFDRRWTHAPAEGADLSDFGTMGFDAVMKDTQAALNIARQFVGSSDRMALGGYSVGGQLAYHYASLEANLPRGERQVKAIVSIDATAAISPEDESLLRFQRASRDTDTAQLDQGTYEINQGFIIAVGALTLAAPNSPSPLVPGMTNREFFLMAMGQAYLRMPVTPLYHLTAPLLAEGRVTGFRESPEHAVASWLAAATPHQALRENADSAALLCNEGPLPIDAPIDRIRVPILYLGAAGGLGDCGLYALQRVQSTDVTPLIVRRFGTDRIAEDIGHADLMFASDAPSMVWRPLSDWLSRVANQQDGEAS